MENNYALVYKLCYHTRGHEVVPGHIWGTTDAIEALGNCRPVFATERQVPLQDLDAAGFLYEAAEAA